MADVVDLKTRPMAVHESAQRRAEELVSQILDGTVTQVAIAVVHANGSVACSWSETDDFGRLLGSVSRLQHRLNILADED